MEKAANGRGLMGFEGTHPDRGDPDDISAAGADRGSPTGVQTGSASTLRHVAP